MSAPNTSTSPSRQPDAILFGGTVYDGSGSPGLVADVAMSGDTIVAIGAGLRASYPAAKPYDAAGCAVAPGFIDIHTHSDLTVLAVPSMSSSIHQGVTTEMTGNCGMCLGLVDAKSDIFKQERGWLEREGIKIDWSRIAGFFHRIEAQGVSSNIGILAGHNTIRKSVMGFAQAAPNPAELAAMQAKVAEAMEDGAFGFSTGLEYVPGSFTGLDEACALADIAHQAGGFYASHMRSEGDLLMESVNETIAVGERTGIPVQISHHKAEGKANWGKVRQTLARMQAARDAGHDVLTDQYPYTAFMTGLSVILLPQWARSGSPEEVQALLADTETRARIEKEIEAAQLDYDAITVGVARGRPEIQGLTLKQLGAKEAASPASAALDLLVAEKGWVGAAHFALCEEDVEAILRDPHTMIGSDGVATTTQAPEKPHPRSYGTFPRVLARYVRERGVLSLSEAIRRMTSLPASRLRLTDRGRIAPGMKADLAVFRPDAIADLATFEAPHQFPVGMEYVFVNGALAVERGEQTAARAGVVLRRP